MNDQILSAKHVVGAACSWQFTANPIIPNQTQKDYLG